MVTKSMKVGFLLPGLGFIKRGAEQAFIEIGKELAKNGGLEVVFYGGGNLNVPGTRSVCVPLVKRYFFEKWPRIPPFRDSGRYEDFFYSMGLFFSLLRDPCDVYITCSAPFTFITLRFLKFIFQRKFRLYFSTQNGVWFTRGIKEGRLFFCDGVLCTNPVYLDELKGRYPTVLTPNGFDAEAWRKEFGDEGPAHGRGQESRSIKNILCVAALIREKKLDLVVQAVARLKNCELTIVGEGPERARLQQLAGKADPERIKFVGGIPHNEVLKYYKEADLFINLKEDEPSSLAFVEAMASGVPILAHDSAINRWILGEAGIFLKTNSAEELARTILQTLELPDISQKTAALRQRAFQEFPWQKIASTLYSFIGLTK